MLRLRTAYSSGSEEAARVYDEDDERRRGSYNIVTTVDVDRDDIVDAWELEGQGFGAELARRASLRTLNLGFGDRRGERVEIAGVPRHVTGFTVCMYCGAVRDAREGPQGGTDDKKLHQGWCRVRSGSKKAHWEQIVLYHQLTTEAVRILVPVSMFLHEERLASFKGALLLGLRQDIGGDPDHLEIAHSDMPNQRGDGRRRFLMLYDRVPGGTGYLARLAQPERMREILTGARELLNRCACVGKGERACHLCLLGVVERDAYDLVRRDLAVDILDELLAEWTPQKVKSVADIDIGRVEESELERRFKVALQDWAHGPARPDEDGDERVALVRQPARQGRDAFDLRIPGPTPGSSTHWRLDEQEEGLGTSPNTVPDFYFRRLDDRSPDVAVYLDGYQFHAAPDNREAIAKDATKRAALRDSGRLVWNLTWDDVKDFHTAVAKDPPAAVPAPAFLCRVLQSSAGVGARAVRPSVQAR